MAVSINTSVGNTNYLQRSSGILPAASGDATVFFWLRASVNTPTAARYRTFFTLIDSGAYNDWAGLFSRIAGVDVNLDLGVGGVDTGSAYGTAAINVYRAVAWTKTGTTHKFYLGVPLNTPTISLVDTITDDISAAVFANDFIGTDGTASSWGNLNVQCMRQWTACLTQAEIEAEMRSIRAYRTANLYLDVPLLTDALDVSGNARDYSTVTNGSLSYQTTDTLIALSPDNYLSVTSLPTSLPVTAADYNAGTYATVVSGSGVNQAWVRVSGVSGYVGVMLDAPYPTYGTAFTVRVYKEAVGLQLVETTSNHTLDGGVHWTQGVGEVYWVRVTSSANSSADLSLVFTNSAPAFHYDADITSFPYSTTIAAATFNVRTEYVFRVVVTESCVISAHGTDLNSGVFSTYLRLVDDEHDGQLSTASSPGLLELRAAGTYYISVRSSAYGTASGVANQTIAFRADRYEYLDAIPEGSYVINDDSFDNFDFTLSRSATVWDYSTGNLLGFLQNVPASEHGITLPNGYSLWHARYNVAGTRLVLLDPDAAIIATLDLPDTVGSGANDVVFAISDTDFYVANFSFGANGDIYKITTAGVVSLFASPTSVSYSMFAISRDQTKLYLAYMFDKTLKTWDIESDTLESTITLSLTGWTGTGYMARTPFGQIGDLLIMDDDSLVTWYVLNSYTTGPSRVVHFRPDGTILANYEMPTGSPNTLVDHMHYVGDDRTTQVMIWRFTNLSTNTAAVERIDLSTGTRTTISAERPMWSVGVGEPDPAGTSPIIGPSSSCAFVLSRIPTYTADYQYGTEREDDAPTDVAAPAECCDTGTSTGDTGTNPDPVGDLPPWTASCIGGGLVEQVADVAEGELW